MLKKHPFLGSVIFTFIAPAFVAGVMPFILLSYLRVATFHFPGRIFMASLLLITGLMIYIACVNSFIKKGKGTPSPTAPPTQLVVSGLYRYSRNPMYVGIISIIIGEGLWFAEASVLIWAALFLMGVHAWILNYEEPKLRSCFGSSYHDYCQRVRRWV